MAGQPRVCSGIPVLHAHHDSPLDYSHSWWRRLAYSLSAPLIGHLMTDAALFAADATRQQYIQRGWVAAGRALHAPVGVDLAKVRHGRQKRQVTRQRYAIADETILWVQPARLAPEKGQATLLEALAQLSDQQPWHLLLVGDGPAHAMLAHQVAALGLAHRVRLLGALPHDATLDLIHAADWVVLPSHFEYASVALAEALALDTPCLVSDVGDSWPMVGGGALPAAGWGFPADNRAALTHTLARTLTEPGLRALHSQACAARAARLAHSHHLKAVDFCLKKLL
ncbi:MAG: glycosyltransferase [Anaerolineae bacterium]|nr:glycosyltransferase [Anaerolineae bacterium]